MAPNPVPTPLPTPSAVLDARDQIVTVLITQSVPFGQPTGSAKQQNATVSAGPIAGGLVGGIVGGILLAGFCWWYRGWRQRREAEKRRILARRRTRLMSMYNEKGSSIGRRSMSSSASLNSRYGLRSISPSSSTTFEPHVPMPAPRRPSHTYSQSKQYDYFDSEKGYGYEPQPLTYVPAGGDFMVQQQPYESMSMSSTLGASIPPVPAVPSHLRRESHATVQFNMVPQVGSGQRSPPDLLRKSAPPAPILTTNTTVSRPRVSHRSSLSQPGSLKKQHRPSRPSPLSHSVDGLPAPGPETLVFFEQLQSTSNSSSEYTPSGPSSRARSDSGGSSTAPSSTVPSDGVHVTAAPDTWGIALGSPEHDRFEFHTGNYRDDQKRAVAATMAVLDPESANMTPEAARGLPGQYSDDPFEEYHYQQKFLEQAWR